MINTSLTISPSLQTERQALRKLMRYKRANLSKNQQEQAALSLIPSALTLIEQYKAQTLAFYLPFNGEISPVPLMNLLQKEGKKITLPVLHPFSENQLLFLDYQSDKDLEQNQFGIWQPKLDVRKVVPVTELDMIFVPLVACDKAGNRLGMGGGFYDRTLSQSHLISVGLAHRCQQVETLAIADWDMPLSHLLIGDCEE